MPPAKWKYWNLTARVFQGKWEVCDIIYAWCWCWDCWWTVGRKEDVRNKQLCHRGLEWVLCWQQTNQQSTESLEAKQSLISWMIPFLGTIACSKVQILLLAKGIELSFSLGVSLIGRKVEVKFSLSLLLTFTFFSVFLSLQTVKSEIWNNKLQTKALVVSFSTQRLKLPLP